MQDEILEHFGLIVPLDKAGYYETDRHKELFKDIRNAIFDGKLIALCGLIGSGKTVTLKRLQTILEDDKKVTVSRSLSIEKNTVKLGALLAALFYDISTEKNIQIPKGVERREREFLELLKKNKRPVVMFIDEAHDLNGNTLIGLKRLIELVEQFDAKPTEIKALFNNTLDPIRATELRGKMLQAGLPL